MLIKNMEYLSQRLRCTDEEKDACLEAVTVILHFWTDVRKNGLLAIGGDRAEQDPNPFFRACLLDAIELVSTDDEPLLEDLFAQYLIAGDYTGAGFLQNVVIAEGILAYLRFFHEHEDGGSFQQWGDRLAVVVGGYFGVEYREKLRKTIRQEIRKRRGTGSYFIRSLPGRTGGIGDRNGRVSPRTADRCRTRPAGDFGESRKLSSTQLKRSKGGT